MVTIDQEESKLKRRVDMTENEKILEKEKELQESLQQYEVRDVPMISNEEQIKIDEEGLKVMISNKIPKSIIERRKRIIAFKQKALEVIEDDPVSISELMI